MRQLGSYAITYTIKNEAQFLKDGLTFHLLNGCKRVYLFFDGTEDDSRQIASAFDERVISEETIPLARIGSVPPWIQRILPSWHDNYDTRKRINTYFAALQAREAGIEWLFTIDADEVLLFRAQEADGPGNSEDFLSRIPANVHQVLMPPHEAVPTGPGTNRPMVDCRYFLNRFPVTDTIWKLLQVASRPILRTPKQRAWLDYWVYRIRCGARYPRLLKSPLTGEIIPTGFYLGYWNHKAGIRTKAVPRYGFNTHMWAEGGRLPPSLRAGVLLHYDLPNAVCYRNKFQQRNSWYTNRTSTFFVRHALATIARELTKEKLEEFFLEQLAVTDPFSMSDLLECGVVRQFDCVVNKLLPLDATQS
jgi:hypothetical protein